MLILQIRAVPVRDIGWRFDQRLQPLLRAWVIAYVEFIEIQHGPQPLDQLAGNRTPRNAELAQRGRRNQTDEQSEDDDYHEQFKQGEASLGAGGTIAMNIPLLACMASVAAFYHLPPRVLPSIQAVEGGAIGVVHRNANGSQDLGVMQVNTRWLESLARVAHLTPVHVRVRLIYDECFNVAAAGAIMRSYLNETAGDLMLAVGDYHSHTPTLNQDYQDKVLASAYRLFGNGSHSAAPHVAAPRTAAQTYSRQPGANN